MLFKIRDKSNKIYYYDNITNVLHNVSEETWQKLKQQYLPLQNKGVVKPFDFNDKKYPFPKKQKHLSFLRIQVGLNCNFKCSFCTQSTGKFENVPVSNKSHLDKFWEKFDEADISLTEKASIELWGGEPLVYWKTLLILIPEIRRRFPNNPLSFFTNGTLLTKEKVDFLIKYNVTISVSHDALGYFLRGEDPLKDNKILEIWKYAKDKYTENNLPFRINCVLTQYNADLNKVDKFFKDYFGKDVFYRYEGVVISMFDNCVQYAEFSKEYSEKLFSTLYEGLKNDHKNITKAIEPRLSNLIRVITYNYSAEFIPGKCNAMYPDVMTLDLDGNILDCHNVSPQYDKIGELPSIESCRVDKFKHWSLRKKCSDCIYLASCRGGCSRTSDFFHEKDCVGNTIFHKAIFYAAFYKITGNEILDIKNLG